MNRSDACQELREHWVDIQQQAIVRAVNEMYALDCEEICDKIMLGDIKFGPFEPHKMDLRAEFREELKDAIAYHLFTVLCGQE